MTLRRLSLSALALAGLTSCDVDPRERLAVQRPAIIGGQEDTGHPAVGVLKMGEHAICTATLIGRQTVLTAAHCIEGFDLDPNKRFAFATDATVAATTSEATERVAHPDYTPGPYTADVAVLKLAQRIVGVAPMLLLADPPLEGEALTMVGFGLTTDRDDPLARVGKKRVGTNRIAYVRAEDFMYSGTTGDGTCSGDSGGPSFVLRGGVEALAGVHSTGGTVCGTSSRDIRVDVFRPWIAERAGADLYDGSPIDTVPPQVQLVAPTDGTELTPPLFVEAAASDDVGVARVVLKIDSREVQTLQAEPFRFEVASLDEGFHQLDVFAYDAEGNSASAGCGIEVVAEAPPPGPDAGLPATDAGPPTEESSGGCAVTGPLSGELPVIALLVLGILRRGRAPAQLGGSAR